MSDDDEDDDAPLGAVHSLSWVPDVYSTGFNSKTNIAAGGVFRNFADWSIPSFHPCVVHTQLDFPLSAL